MILELTGYKSRSMTSPTVYIETDKIQAVIVDDSAEDRPEMTLVLTSGYAISISWALYHDKIAVIWPKTQWKEKV